MPCDMFEKIHARNLLANKHIAIIGDSNMRALYKDILWLLEYGTLTEQETLKIKNEYSYLNDQRLSNGPLCNEVTYQEIREYNEYSFIKFMFITRCYAKKMREWLKALFRDKHRYPDILIISSSLWDLSRWGSDSINQYISDIPKLMKFLSSEAPVQTRIIWVTGPPPAENCHGGCISEDLKDLLPSLPWLMVQANEYASRVANYFKIDVLDTHYYLNNIIDYRANDGIHWTPIAMRFITNMLLTHISLAWNMPLPCNHPTPELITLNTKDLVYNEALVNTINNAIKSEESVVKLKRPEPLGRNSKNRLKKLAEKRKIWEGNFPKLSNKVLQTESFNYPPPPTDLPHYFDSDENITKNTAQYFDFANDYSKRDLPHTYVPKRDNDFNAISTSDVDSSHQPSSAHKDETLLQNTHNNYSNAKCASDFIPEPSNSITNKRGNFDPPPFDFTFTGFLNDEQFGSDFAPEPSDVNVNKTGNYDPPPSDFCSNFLNEGKCGSDFVLQPFNRNANEKRNSDSPLSDCSSDFFIQKKFGSDFVPEPYHINAHKKGHYDIPQSDFSSDFPIEENFGSNFVPEPFHINVNQKGNFGSPSSDFASDFPIEENFGSNFVPEPFHNNVNKKGNFDSPSSDFASDFLQEGKCGSGFVLEQSNRNANEKGNFSSPLSDFLNEGKCGSGFVPEPDRINANEKGNSGSPRSDFASDFLIEENNGSDFVPEPYHVNANKEGNYDIPQSDFASDFLNKEKCGSGFVPKPSNSNANEKGNSDPPPSDLTTDVLVEEEVNYLSFSQSSSSNDNKENDPHYLSQSNAVQNYSRGNRRNKKYNCNSSLNSYKSYNQNTSYPKYYVEFNFYNSSANQSCHNAGYTNYFNHKHTTFNFYNNHYQFNHFHSHSNMNVNYFNGTQSSNYKKNKKKYNTKRSKSSNDCENESGAYETHNVKRLKYDDGNN